jgi:hypothetical protein
MTDDQTQHPVDAGLVEIAGKAIGRNMGLRKGPHELGYAALSAIVATGGAVLDEKAVRDLEQLLKLTSRWLSPYTPESVREQLNKLWNTVTAGLDADLARIAAALPKEGE